MRTGRAPLRYARAKPRKRPASGGDAYPPSIPTGLAVTGSSSTQVNLAWSASTDTGGSGLKGYNVYRNSVIVGSQITATTYQDTGLSAATTYTYTVSALDNAGNVSAQSAPLQVTTPGAGSSPTWNTSSLSIIFVQGTASTYDFRPFLNNFTAGTHGVWLVSTGVLPTGVTFATNLYQLQYDGTSPVAGPLTLSFDVGLIDDAKWFYILARPGVLRSTARGRPWPSRRFETSVELDQGRYPDDLNDPNIAFDTAVKVFPGGNSVRHTVPKTSPQQSRNSFNISFGDVANGELVEFRENSTFWFMLLKRYDDNWLNQVIEGFGYKNWICAMTDKAGYTPQNGQGFASSSAPYGTLVGQFTDFQNALYVYHTNTGVDIADALDSSADGVYNDSLGRSHTGRTDDRRYYNAFDQGAGVTRLSSRYGPTRCGLRESPNNRVFITSPTGSHQAAPENHPFRIYPNEWVAWCYRVDVGPLTIPGHPTLGRTEGSLPDQDQAFNSDQGYRDSRLRAWGYRFGRDSDWVRLIDKSDITLTRFNGDGAAVPIGQWVASDDFQGWGKLHLTNFLTNGVADANRQFSNDWTGGLVVSTQAIPNPVTLSLPP